MKSSAELIPILEQHEQLLIFSAFDADIAWDLGSAARQAFLNSDANKTGKGAVIAIELFSGHTLFRTVVGKGVTADNWCVHVKYALTSRLDSKLL
jgi:uncharacterized protein (UPF0303 family)